MKILLPPFSFVIKLEILKNRTPRQIDKMDREIFLCKNFVRWAWKGEETDEKRFLGFSFGENTKDCGSSTYDTSLSDRSEFTAALKKKHGLGPFLTLTTVAVSPWSKFSWQLTPIYNGCYAPGGSHHPLLRPEVLGSVMVISWGLAAVTKWEEMCKRSRLEFLFWKTSKEVVPELRRH